LVSSSQQTYIFVLFSSLHVGEFSGLADFHA
jgi:hypothetical protein